MFPFRRPGTRLVSLVALFSTMVFAFRAVSVSAQVLSLAQSSARYAGIGSGGFNVDSGPATTVSLNAPTYVVFDSIGNQYISDTLNNCVRKIDGAGNMSTVAGLTLKGQGDTCNTGSNATPMAAQGLFRPTGLAVDGQNRLYIADSMHHCVRSMANGAMGTASLTTVAGTCGPAASASVTPAPSGLAIDGSGNLYISVEDNTSSVPVNQVLRHAAGLGVADVCLVAGEASANVTNSCGNGNGVALVNPSGLAFDAAGDLFVADTGNDCVREIAGMKTMATAAGRCVNDGSGVADMGLRNPFGLAFSPTGTLFITEQNPDNVVSYVPGANAVKIAGGLPSGTAGSYSSNQDGKSALNTPLNGPKGIAFDSFGNLSVADSKNNILRKLSSNIIFPTTPVGSMSAVLPITFAVNGNVNLSVGPMSDFNIISSGCAGVMSTAQAGASPTTCQVFVRFMPLRPGLRSSPLTITDRNTGTSVVMGLTGTGTGALSVFTPGIVNTLASSLAGAAAVAMDARGNAYVLESAQTATTPSITLIPAGGGTRQVIVGKGMGLATPTAMAVDAAGDLYVADAAQGTVLRFGADGSVNPSFVTGLDTPTAVTVDGFGNLYIAQAGQLHNIVEIYAAGLRRIVAGSGNAAMADGVPATMAKFVAPGALTIDLKGTLYVADTGGHVVYAIDAQGTIHGVAGNGTTATTEVGQATGTGLISPVSVAVDAAGDLYIADASANKVYTAYVSSHNGANIAATLGTGATGSSGDGGVPAAASMRGPVSLALDGGSNLFVVDGGNNSIRMIRYANPVIDFGTVMVGHLSPVMPQEVTNVGTENLNLTMPFVTSDDHFSVDATSTSCGTTILTGSVCSLGFTFTPTSEIAFTAIAKLISNSYNSPQTIQLRGSGKAVTVLTAQSPMNSEMYGQPFTETLIFSNAGSLSPTGTITFSTEGQTLCTVSAAFSSGVAVCNALNSNLPVGSYPVTFSYSGDGNCAPVVGTTMLSVSPAPLTVTVNNATKVYGAATPAFRGTMMGLVSGDTVLLSYISTASASSPSGTYPIAATLTAVGGTNLSNYSTTVMPGTLLVTQAAVSFTLATESEVYGQGFPEAVLFPTSGSVLPSGKITFATGGKVLCTASASSNGIGTTCNAANSGLGVGSYPVSFSYSGDVNFAPASGTTMLTVNPATLTVTANSETRQYGMANPVFTGTLAGVVGRDLVVATYSSSANTASLVGSYAIIPVVSGADAVNYVATILPGTLAVMAANTTTTVASSGRTATVGANVTFTATVSSPNATLTGVVSFTDGSTALGSSTLNASGVATISSTTLSPGTHTITASFASDGNFNGSAASLSQAVAAPVGSFTIAATPGSTPGSQETQGVGSTVYQITLTGVGAFSGPVALSCSGLPADATCSFANRRPNLAVGGTVTTTMTVTNTAADAAKLNKPRIFKPADLAPITAAAVFPVELTGFSVLFAGIRKRKTIGRERIRLLLVICFTLGVLGLSGCGCVNAGYRTCTVTVTGTSTTFPAPAQATSVMLPVGQ